MQNSFSAGTRRGLLLTLFVLGLVTALILVPSQFQSEAGGTGAGLFPRTTSHDERFPNYDIRDDKSDEVADALLMFRQSVGKDAPLVAQTKLDFVRGEESLRGSVPTLKVEYNPTMNTPEVIGPDVWDAPASLTGPSSTKKAEILRNFIRGNNSLVGIDDTQASQLKVTADYTNPDGGISYAHLEQLIDGVPVFPGEIKAGFNKRGEMFRVINNLAPGLDYDALSKEFGDPADAVRAAFTKVSAISSPRTRRGTIPLRRIYESSLAMATGRLRPGRFTSRPSPELPYPLGV